MDNYYNYEQGDVFIREGQVVAGAAIGIIILGGGWAPPLPGDMQNATTFDFPVYYKVADVSVKSVVSTKRDPIASEQIIKAAKELEKQGCRAIVGACGYFANYLADVAAAVNVPAFLSSLMQIPIICCALKPNQKVGIICADSNALSLATLKVCGVTDPSTIVIAGAQDLSQIQNIMQCKGHINKTKAEQELVDFSRKLVIANPDIGAILLESSNMPPYAWAIQKEIRLPVFDFTTMINWVYNAVVRRQFVGIM